MFDLALKDLRIFIRDRKSLFLTFLLPIALITLFSMAYGGLGNDSPQPKRILISDMDNTALSKTLSEEVSRISGISIEASDTVSGGQMVGQGKRLAMLCIFPGYADSLNLGRKPPLELWYDASREVETGILIEALSATIIPKLEKQRTQQGINEFLKQRYSGMGDGFAEGLSKEISAFIQNDNAGSAVILPKGISGQKEVNWGLIQAVAGVAVMMLLFSVSSIGGSILTEKESGTLKRLLISPVSPSMIIMGKFTYSIIVSFTQLSIMFIFGWLAFGLDIWARPIALMINIIATALACSGFGIFLASISQTRRQVESMSTIIILIMSAIGGSMIPTFFMPGFMQRMAVLSVNYWSIQASYDIFGRGTGILEVLWKAGILIGISLVLSIISIRLFKKTLLKLG